MATDDDGKPVEEEDPAIEGPLTHHHDVTPPFQTDHLVHLNERVENIIIVFSIPFRREQLFTTDIVIGAVSRSIAVGHIDWRVEGSVESTFHSQLLVETPLFESAFHQLQPSNCKD